nr:hypothetical protein [Tanacetum cinerariifolium]
MGVLDLEKTKTTQRNEIDSLKRTIKKLEKRNRSRTHKLKRLYKGKRIDVDEDITLINDADNEMFDVDDLGGEEVFIAGQNENVAEEIVYVAQLVNGIVFQEPGKSTTTTTISSQQSHDKGKGIMIEEHVKPKKNDQIRLDEEVALKLQAKFDEEERLARERAEKEQEANIALIETQVDIQAKIDVDHQLAERLQAQEQEGTELVEGKEKRAGTELEQEITKKQKVEDDKEKAELKQLMETIPNEKEVAIDAIPLDVKSPRIVDWKIYKEEKKSYYQIARADRKSQMYMIFSQMLKIFDREDFEDLYKLVKARYGSTRPVENIDYLLWSDMKTMFEQHVEDEIWKLYDSRGVYSLMMHSMQI